ncbi:MAG: hypothetical protein A3F09_00190 [Chlamydiae bacterium RIFCSPHIGHO2_12_FULL_49_11]|nr:MAG: hypothetical protein A3F09_00190 [Chlamydiae bacterium RIFCSPHIGHO2_12_FULL_49_11]
MVFRTSGVFLILSVLVFHNLCCDQIVTRSVDFKFQEIFSTRNQQLIQSMETGFADLICVTSLTNEMKQLIQRTLEHQFPYIYSIPTLPNAIILSKYQCLGITLKQPSQSLRRSSGNERIILCAEKNTQDNETHGFMELNAQTNFQREKSLNAQMGVTRKGEDGIDMEISIEGKLKQDADGNYDKQGTISIRISK